MAGNKNSRVKLVGMVLTILLVILSIYLIRMQAMILKDARREVLIEETALADTRLQFLWLTNSIDHGASLEEEFDRYRQMLPQTPGEDRLINHIQNKAAGSGLKLMQIQFESRKSFDRYVEMPFTAVFEGAFHSFVQFLAGVQSGPRIIHIRQFQISKTGGSSAVIVTVSGSAFYAEKL